MKTDRKINSILHDLSEVRENLISLSDDIWLNIDHNNTEKMQRGFEAKKEFNRLFEQFDKNAQSIITLVLQFNNLKEENSQPTDINPVQKLDIDHPVKSFSDVGFYYRGKFFQAVDSQKQIDLLVSLLNEITKEDPEFLQKFIESGYNRGTKRTFISNSEQLVTVIADDGRVFKPKQLENGYWLINNISVTDKMKIIKGFAKITEQNYGKDGIFAQFKKKRK